MEAAEYASQNEKSKFTQMADTCINAMVRLINFDESPICRILGMTQEEECDFLSKERREDIIARCYNGKSRSESFAALNEWIRKNGHQHTQHQGPDGKPIHMSACPVCMKAARKAMVHRFRADTKSTTAEYFKALVKAINHPPAPEPTQPVSQG